MNVRVATQSSTPCDGTDLGRSKSGQVFTEYLIVFGMTIGVLVMLALFLTVFKEYGGRILDLVASEFP